MRRNIFAYVGAALVVAFSFVMMPSMNVCSAYAYYHPTPAYIDAAEAAIGGVQIGSKREYIRDIYGEPTRIEKGTSVFGDYEYWYYGDSFKIYLMYGAYYVESNADNGLKTPAGFTVGQYIQPVIDYFGSDTMKKSIHKGVTTYSFYVQAYKGIGIQTDRRGKITKIYCWEDL